MADNVTFEIRCRNLSQAAFDEVSASLKSLGATGTVSGIQASTALTSIEQSTKQLGTTTKETDGAFSGFIGHYLEARVIWETAREAYRSMVEFITSSLDVYAEAESAERRLTTAIQTQGFAIPGLIDQYKQLGNTYQQTTAFSHTAIDAAEALFVQLGNVGPDMMARAVQAATDLSSGLGINLTSAVEMVSRAFEGHTTGLTRYGIVLDAARVKGEGMTYVLDAIEGKVGGQAQAELDTYAGKVKQLGNAWDDFKEHVGGAIASDPMLQAALRAVTENLDSQASSAHTAGNALDQAFDDSFNPGVARGLKYLHGLMVDDAEAANAMAAAIKDIPGGGLSFKLPTPSTTLPSVDGASDFAAQLRAQWAEEAKAAEEAAKRTAAAIAALAVNLSGAAVDEKVRELSVAFDRLSPATQASADTLRRVNDAAVALVSEGGMLPSKIQAIVDKFDAQKSAADLLKETTDYLATSWKGLKIAIDESFDDGTWATRQTLIGHSVDGWTGLNSVMVNTAATAKLAQKNMSDLLAVDPSPWAAEFEAAAGKAGLSILSVFSDGGNIGHALQRGASDLGAVGGDMMMNSLTNSLWSSGNSGLASTFDKLAPGLGGAVVTLGIDLGKKLWNEVFGNAGRQAVEQFATSVGGFDVLHAQLQALGPAGEPMWIMLTQGTPANNPQQAAANIKKVQDALSALNADVQKYGLTYSDLTVGSTEAMAAQQAAASALEASFADLTGAGYTGDSVVKGMATDVNTWLANTLAAGAQIPPGMEPIVDKLIQMGLLTDANKNKLLGLSEVTLDGGTFDDVTKAAQKYGIQIDALGPKVNQLQIDSAAATLSADWKTLTSDGEDVNAVMDGMKGQVQDVVTEALKFGDTIPESMKPMIDAMITAGDLTDGLGNKLTDDSKLNFAKPIEQSVDDLVTAVGKLVDTLSKGITFPVKGQYVPDPNMPVGSKGGTDDGGGGDDGSLPKHAVGAYIRADHVAQVHAGEIVGPMDFMTRALAGALAANGGSAGGGSDQSIVINLDGQKMADILVRHVPDSLARFGIR